jgi:hypothetical protein
LAGHGFTHILSLLESPHNLHAYEEAGIPFEHIPLGRHDDWGHSLALIFATLKKWLDDPTERVLIHHEEFGDRLLGVIAGYLMYSGLVEEGPHAIVAAERLAGRELGATGREIVAVTAKDHIVRTARTARSDS